MLRRLLLVLVLTAANGGIFLHAQEVNQVNQSGDTTEYVAGEIVHTGNARIGDDTFLLLADTIRYHTTTGIAVAEGRVEFTYGSGRILADKLTYNTKDRTYQAQNVRMGSHPFYAEGSSVSGSATDATVENATVTLREPGPFVPRINADRIHYSSEKGVSAAPDAAKNVSVERGQVGVGPVLPIRLPKFRHRLDDPLLSHVSFNAGYRSSLGASLLAGLQLPVGPGLQLGGDAGLYTKRGVMFGPSGRYVSQSGSASVESSFRSGFINDHGDKKLDVLGRPVPENRAFAAFEHHQEIADRVSINARASYWKDSEILRDFRPDEFFRVQEPDTFLDAVHTGPNYFVSLFARFQPNRFHRVQQRLPELRFDLLPLAIGNGFYQQFSASAAVLRERPPGSGAPRDSDRLDAYYALSRPFAPREWISVVPVAGGRATHYANGRGAFENRNYTRFLGELGLDAELRSSATFTYKNEAWKIDGLRHLLTPRVSYRYVPEADRGRRYIPPIDRRVFSTYLQPLGLGATRNIDELAATNTLRVSLDNTLQTRDATYGSRDLVVFNTAADFRFRRSAGERDVSEIHTDLSVRPASWLQIDLYESFSPRNLSLREFNSAVTIRDGNAWSLRVANHFLRRDTEEYAVEAMVRLNEVYDTHARLHYDARKRRFVEQSFGLRQNLSNTWLINYGVTLYGGPRRESRFGFHVRVDAIGF